MNQTDLNLINWLLTEGVSIDSKPVESLKQWKTILNDLGEKWTRPFQRAVVGGFLADRTAYAFLTGFRAALQRLFPLMSPTCMAAFCISEEGGNHPKFIRTNLERTESSNGKQNNWVLNGNKKFITGATEADTIFVAASLGFDENGRNDIRLVKLKSNLEGVVINPMETLPFIPEISHGSVAFENVMVEDQQILEGDGYLNYIKPFRYLEDVHVSSSVLGFLYRTACLFSWEASIKEKLISLILLAQGLAEASPEQFETHIAFAGFQKQMDRLTDGLDSELDKTPRDFKAAWIRDRQIFTIAEKARHKRLEKAWNNFQAR
ncbi:acyl-CoA dehydrogenase family protein [bacterium]|nr:acyl-CoA dehydrogenase family protein [bacterium]